MQLDDGAVVDMDGKVVEQPDTSMKPSKVTATDETVTELGMPRAYQLAVPKTYDAARKYPLIIALHGDGPSALVVTELLVLLTVIVAPLKG